MAAVVLLQVARRLSLPYPSMLALAGVGVALLPGAPDFPIDPRTALPLFIAPALMDAAFDFPIQRAKRFWVPLLVFALGGAVRHAGRVGAAEGDASYPRRARQQRHAVHHHVPRVDRRRAPAPVARA